MPANMAGLGTMATPVVGLLFSWALLGEQPTGLEIVGMIAILAGSAILFVRAMRDDAGTRSPKTRGVGAPPTRV